MVPNETIALERSQMQQQLNYVKERQDNIAHSLLHYI